MKRGSFLLMVIICFYGIMYMATDPRSNNCVGDCANFRLLSDYFRKDSNTIYGLQGCGRQMTFDSICVYIKDTTRKDWNALADSVCMISTKFNLPKGHVFVINNLATAPDTLVKVSCP